MYFVCPRCVKISGMSAQRYKKNLKCANIRVFMRKMINTYCKNEKKILSLQTEKYALKQLFTLKYMKL